MRRGLFPVQEWGGKGLKFAADTGTILLDEISELSMAAQAKLLNFIQEKEFLPIGQIKPLKVDVKIIAATNKNLKNMVDIRTFREDLYYRVNLVDIYIPPYESIGKISPCLLSIF